MKHIINVLKNEIFNHNKAINDLVKKVTVSQEAYLKDRTTGSASECSGVPETVFGAWKALLEMTVA